MRPPIWTLFAIPILGALGWFVYMNQNTLFTQPPVAVLQEDEELLSCTPAGANCIHQEVTPHYEISINYPKDAGVTQREIERALKEQVDIFKQDLVAMLDDAEKMRIEQTGRKYEFIIEYTPFSGSGYTSYQFVVYLDTGGAHPNTFFKTLVFNAQGSEVKLEDLFIQGGNYLTTLSELAYEKVLVQLQSRVEEVSPDMEDTIRLGTSPSPEALQHFVIDGGDLVLLFPPYQVAAYAAGSFEARIPLSSLSDLR